jgi:hypothetical protein
MLELAAALQLMAAGSNASICITWELSLGADGYALESSPTLGSNAIWTTLAIAATYSGISNLVVLPATNTARFFRLRR